MFDDLPTIKPDRYTRFHLEICYKLPAVDKSPQVVPIVPQRKERVKRVGPLSPWYELADYFENFPR